MQEKKRDSSIGASLKQSEEASKRQKSNRSKEEQARDKVVAEVSEAQKKAHVRNVIKLG